MRANVLSILILKYTFRPEKLPELSRNGPQVLRQLGRHENQKGNAKIRRAGSGKMGAVTGKGRERACKHFFNDTLPPTFSKFLDNQISAVKLSKCQFVGIVLKFLARVFAQSRYANARKYSCLPARLIFRFCAALSLPSPFAFFRVLFLNSRFPHYLGAWNRL